MRTLANIFYGTLAVLYLPFVVVYILAIGLIMFIRKYYFWVVILGAIAFGYYLGHYHIDNNFTL